MRTHPKRCPSARIPPSRPLPRCLLCHIWSTLLCRLSRHSARPCHQPPVPECRLCVSANMLLGKLRFASVMQFRAANLRPAGQYRSCTCTSTQATHLHGTVTRQRQTSAYRHPRRQHTSPNSASSLDACEEVSRICLLYTSPSPRDRTRSRMPSSA